MAEGVSIHPGVVGGRRQFPVVDTCAPRSSRRLLKAAAGLERHIEQNPRDAAARSRLATLMRKISELPKSSRKSDAA